MTKRKTTQQEQGVFCFLNELREEGITNMFGATPYIQEAFGIEKTEARSLLSLWMKVFNKECEYDEIDCKD